MLDVDQFEDKNINVITAGCEYSYPPYSFRNENGAAAGFSVELFKAAAAEMDLEVEFNCGKWSQLKSDLANQKIDALPLVGRTPEREDIFDFTIPYLSMHGTIVVREDQTRIHSMTDLRRKTVAVLDGDNAEEYLRRSDIKTNIITTSTFEEALLELSEGKYDAVVIQKHLALQIIKDKNLDNLKTVGDPRELYQQSFCFAVSEGNAELLNLLNEGLSMVIADGTFDMLQKKWFAPLEAMQELPERIIIGGDENYPPFEFLDENGQPAGYNVELTQAIAKQLSISVEISLTPWNEIRKQLQEGEVDALQGMFYSRKRDKTFDLSPAHTVISYVIAGRNDQPLPENLSKLAGQSILVQRGDIMHDKLLELGLKDEIVAVESQEQALGLLSQGKYDYALVAKLLAHYYNAENNWNNITLSEKSVYSQEYCYAVRNGNTNLLAKLSEGLAAIKATGKYREIYTKWLGVYEQDKINFLVILKYSLFILIPLLILLAITSSWTYLLKKRVKHRTEELRDEIKQRKVIQQRLEKSEKKYRAIVETTNEAMAVVHDSTIQFFNSAFIELTGYSRIELHRTKIDEIFIDKQINKLLNNIDKTGNSLTLHKETKIQQKDGNILDIELESTRINFENQEALLLVCQDITERKALFEQLQKTQDQVDKLGDLIPICSSCKKIQDRDKEDEPWIEPEVYINERIEDIKFTHGICPECLKKLYPEFYNNKNK